MLNNLAKNKNYAVIDNSGVSNTSTIVSENHKRHEAVTGEKKDESTYNNQTEIIEQFLNKCNEGDMQRSLWLAFR